MAAATVGLVYDPSPMDSYPEVRPFVPFGATGPFGATEAAQMSNGHPSKFATHVAVITTSPDSTMIPLTTARIRMETASSSSSGRRACNGNEWKMSSA